MRYISRINKGNILEVLLLTVVLLVLMAVNGRDKYM